MWSTFWKFLILSSLKQMMMHHFMAKEEVRGIQDFKQRNSSVNIQKALERPKRARIKWIIVEYLREELMMNDEFQIAIKCPIKEKNFFVMYHKRKAPKSHINFEAAKDADSRRSRLEKKTERRRFSNQPTFSKQHHQSKRQFAKYRRANTQSSKGEHRPTKES